MVFVDRLVIVFSKVVSFTSRLFRLGAGATWPGEIALTLRPNILRSLSESFKKGTILVAGTNGKTTTTLMIQKILESVGAAVVHNATGANLANGIVSSCVERADWFGRMKADIGVFEVDENTLPFVCGQMKPDVLVLLNLFRDQLDRYGEVDVIVEKWIRAIKTLPASTRLILNGDDPGVFWVSVHAKGKVVYFGVNDAEEFIQKPEHATDSTFCPKCGSRLTYDGVYYSHIGVWRCALCALSRPSPHVFSFPSALPGLYNRYNTLAAVACVKEVRVSRTIITKALASFTPAFGRQEEIQFQNRTITLFLSKNPAGFNVSLRTVIEQGAKYFLFVLNDRVPDGHDISWIWDVDVEAIPDKARCFVSGDRVYDMALRLKYAGITLGREYEFEDSPRAIRSAIQHVPEGETLYVLPTYSAMLEVRKALTGRKIL